MAFDFYDWNKRHAWFSSLAWAAAVHLALIVALMFWGIPSEQNSKEHVTGRFRVKGVVGVPRIAGNPGAA